MKIEKSLLSNRNNPHYFICKNNINVITKDCTIVDFLPFKDALEAKKYSKKIGCFAVFATHIEYDNIIKNKIKF